MSLPPLPEPTLAYTGEPHYSTDQMLACARAVEAATLERAAMVAEHHVEKAREYHLGIQHIAAGNMIADAIRALMPR